MSGDKIRRITLLVLLLGSVAWVATHRGQFDMEMLESWTKDTGPLGPLLYMLLAAAATILLVPASLFTLAGGVLFGPILGTVYSLFGACAGAAIAFLIARYVASDWIAQKSHGRFKRLILSPLSGWCLFSLFFCSTMPWG